ncbi:RHS repeat-associated core domain-containing protein [Capnocytophaga canimorsus]|uniref:RHS repeat-associated core domain-containing protein n=1 Tax=Capnocytophaga canimorsus TaxID=28188 RepID=UPI00385E5390
MCFRCVVKKFFEILKKKLQHDGKWYYHYDKEGNLILKTPSPSERVGVRQWSLGSWAYEWNANGSLKSVKKPSGQTISFEYDALGRRTAKRSGNKEILYIWSGNVLLHEVLKTNDNKQVITWVYENGSFVPIGKLTENESFSVVSDYLGTPIRAYDEEGNLVWERELDIYGKVKTETQESANFVPFRYQVQYYDSEIDLCYNRFRYYDCNTGTYISQDPISILGGLNIYAYVHDVNGWVDVFGLNSIFNISTFQAPSVALGGTGNNYVVFQQQIDWDAQFNKAGGGVETNLDKALRGDSPLINKNGKWEPIHLHHSRQQGKGPLFELSESMHLHTTNEKGRKALHLFLPNKHPFDEVNRIAFNKVDKPEYWKQRAKAELEARKTKSH